RNKRGRLAGSRAPHWTKSPAKIRSELSLPVMNAPQKRPISILLAAPRGFCAGVDRAIQIVEAALEKWGAPVYVRHEIVHNRHVVARLERVGAVFVKARDACPSDPPVFVSPHDVPHSVPATAETEGMIFGQAHS